MPCYQPMKAFPVGLTAKGKTRYQPAPLWTEFVTTVEGEIVTDYVLWPCGRCIGCKLNYSREWANRMTLEAMEPPEGVLPKQCFVTLTYDEEHLPKHFFYKPNEDDPDEDDVLCWSSPLVKRDMTLFLKRLRKALEPLKIRYYQCGEYGENTKRPHFHLIIFGFDFPDKVPYSDCSTGGIHRVYYNSELLSKCWPYGWSVVADFTWRSAAYVARYVTKKVYGEEKAAHYYEQGLIPETSSCSTRPGIANEYFQNHWQDIYRFDGINMSTPDGGKFVSPPRYFDKLLEELDPDLYSAVKATRREKSDNICSRKMLQTDYSLMEMLAAEHLSFKNRYKEKRGDPHGF